MEGKIRLIVYCIIFMNLNCYSSDNETIIKILKEFDVGSFNSNKIYDNPDEKLRKIAIALKYMGQLNGTLEEYNNSGIFYFNNIEPIKDNNSFIYFAKYLFYNDIEKRELAKQYLDSSLTGEFSQFNYFAHITSSTLQLSNKCNIEEKYNEYLKLMSKYPNLNFLKENFCNEFSVDSYKKEVLQIANSIEYTKSKKYYKHLILGRVYENLGDIENAEKEYTIGLKLNKNSMLEFLLVRLQLLQGDSSSLINERINTLKDKTSNLPEIRQLYSLYYLNKNEIENAIMISNELYEQYGYFDYFEQLVWLNLIMEDYPKVIELINQSVHKNNPLIIAYKIVYYKRYLNETDKIHALIETLDFCDKKIVDKNLLLFNYSIDKLDR